jgi:cobalamin synthase
MFETVAQLIGFVGLIVGVTSTFWKTTRHIIMAGTIGIGCYVVHYFLLDAYSGAIIDGIAGVRGIVALNTNNAYVKSIFYILPVIMIGATAVTVPNVMVGIASILNTYASFSTNPQTLRLFNLLSAPFWFYYNFSENSYAGMCGDVLGASCNIFALYLYRNYSFVNHNSEWRA